MSMFRADCRTTYYALEIQIEQTANRKDHGCKNRPYQPRMSNRVHGPAHVPVKATTMQT